MDVTRVACRAAEIASGIHCTETRHVSTIPWQDSGPLPAHGWEQLENALPVDSVHGAGLWVKDHLVLQGQQDRGSPELEPGLRGSRLCCFTPSPPPPFLFHHH